MKNNKSVGVIAGNFDVIHPGYIKMFNEMRIHVDEIHVFLHINPSLERKEKIKPVLSEFDRVETLLALKGVNNVSSYQTENELKKLLIKVSPDVRFLGDDYINRKDYTGYGLPPKIIFLDRSHGWSTTKFKNLICEKIKQSQL